MNREDLPLVSFTLLVQLALGAVTLAALAPLRVAGASQLAHVCLLTAAGALVIAMAVSLLHLGDKGGALRALRNLRTSWLSREVLFTALFTGLTLAALVLPDANLTWLATLTGFAAVFTMSQLYQQTIRPAWVTLYTPVSFFAAAVALGAALGAPLVLVGGAPDLLLRDIVLTAGGAVAAELAATALYARDLREDRLPMAVRLLVTLAGLALLVLGWYSSGALLACAGAVALAGGTIVGRVRFFALGISTQVGELS